MVSRAVKNSSDPRINKSSSDFTLITELAAKNLFPLVFFLSILGCYKRSNILFLLDNSKNIGYDGFEKSKNFITAIAGYFSPESTSIGLMEFSGSAKATIPFQANRQIEELKSLVNNIKFENGQGHSILNAYDNVATYFPEKPLQGGKIVVLVTAAEETDSTKHLSAVLKRLAYERIGVKFFVVAADDKVTSKRLTDYSSGGTYMYQSEHFDDIIGSVTKIRNTICRLARFS